MGELLSQGPLFVACLVFMMGIIVTIHELGHFAAGRLFGAAVESFSFGFGRPLFERTDRRGTRWRVNWLLFGGFVKFVGESQTAGDVGKVEQGPIGKAYPALTVWQRSIVSLAGPAANFVLAVLIFGLIFGIFGRPNVKVGIGEVVAGAPAERAGLEAGDIVLAANGKPVRSVGDLQIAIILNPGTPVNLDIERDGEASRIIVTPEQSVIENELGQIVSQATIGVRIGEIEAGPVRHYNPAEAVWQGVIETGATISRTTTMLSRIVTGKMSIHTMTGPVGIGDVSRRTVNRIMEQDTVPLADRLNVLFWTLMSICAAISVGVGFFNLLPLPLLDGGHLVFNAYEAVTGRHLPEKVQEVSLTFGLILLLGMVAVITWGDVIETGLFGSRGG